MNALVNKVQLIGRLGADPKVHIFGEDRKVSQIKINKREGYKNKKAGCCASGFLFCMEG